jgi:hypothetical protein
MARWVLSLIMMSVLGATAASAGSPLDGFTRFLDSAASSLTNVQPHAQRPASVPLKEAPLPNLRPDEVAAFAAPEPASPAAAATTAVFADKPAPAPAVASTPAKPAATQPQPTPPAQPAVAAIVAPPAAPAATPPKPAAPAQTATTVAVAPPATPAPAAPSQVASLKPPAAAAPIPAVTPPAPAAAAAVKPATATVAPAPAANAPAKPSSDTAAHPATVAAANAPKPTLAALPGPAADIKPSPPSEATTSCALALAAFGVKATPATAIVEGNCRISAPVTLASAGDITLMQKALLDCATAAALASWLQETVAPKAVTMLGAKLTAIRVLDAYDCRPVNNIPGGNLSEHARGKAIDIGAFRLGDRWITVGAKDLTPADQAFLDIVRSSACGPFTTVLGPGSDEFHSNHFHLDLASRQTAGPSKGLYCQ